MKMRPPIASVLLVSAMLLSSHPALAQFSQQGPKLLGTGAVGNAAQGVSVSLSADGNTAIVGGSLDNNAAGAAWVWTRSGGVWTQQGPKLVGSGAVGNAGQGYSVSLSADGNTAIVGGNLDNGAAGAAWVWTRSGGIWTQQGNKLVGSGAIGKAAQGHSVSLSADGNTAIVGGRSDNSFAGAAWVWMRSGGVWTQQGAKLVGSGAIGDAQQGTSLSLSADGNTAIVGGGTDNNQAGAAWVWTRSGGVWTQQGSRLVGSGAVGSAEQGTSVSLSADGNTAIVGGGADNSFGGAAWVWTRSGGVWTQQGTKLVGVGAVGGAGQGHSVSLSADGKTAIIGGNTDNSFAGAAWVWMRSGGAWTQQGAKLVGSGPVGNALQGASVFLSADASTAIVGGNLDNSGAGAAWIFGAGACAQGSTTLCLNNNRFAVSAAWRTSDGQSGQGQAVRLTADTGYFTFFSATNVEVVIKVLNACGLNSKYWVFAGGLTDVNVVLTVRDTVTGTTRTYTSPSGTAFQPIQDTDAFTTCSATGSSLAPFEAPVPSDPMYIQAMTALPAPAEACVQDATTICLNGDRFAVTAAWRTGDGKSGQGQAVRLTADTGYFTFFSASNVEVVVKVLNACGLNSTYWVFAGGLTNVNVVLTIRDTATGTVKIYANPLDTAFQPIQDTSAFATCGAPALESASALIHSSTGGTITLPSGIRVTIPAGTFPTDQSVTVRSDPMSDEDTFLYGEAEGALDAGPSIQRVITIDTGTQVPLNDVSIALPVPDTFLAQISATRGPVILVENYSFDDTESEEAFDPVDSSYDAPAKRITAMIPAWAFTDQRASSGALQAAFTLGSLSLDGAATHPNGLPERTAAQSAPNCYRLQTDGCFTPTGGYQSPLVGIPLTALTINSPYGKRSCQGCSGNHDGVDVKCVDPAGDPVQPMVTGWIAKIGVSPFTGQMIGVGFIGTDKHEYLVLYYHLKPHSIQVPGLTDCIDYPCSSTPDPNQHWNGSRGACHNIPKVGRQCGYYQTFPRDAYRVAPSQTIGITDHSGWTPAGVPVPCHLHLEVGNPKIPNDLPAHVGRIDPIGCGVIPSVMLQLSTTGTGNGTISLRVASQPVVTCPLPGTFNIGKGLCVTLTAKPDTSNGSVFGGWQGVGCGGTAPTCKLTLTGDATIAAMFNGPAACSTQQVAGGNTPETRIIEMGKSSGTFSFGYNTFTIPDEMIVTYEGKVLFDTGCVGQSDVVTLSYAGVSTKISVQVKPNCQGDTSTGWEFTVGCPK